MTVACARCGDRGEVAWWPQDDSINPDWEPCPECQGGADRLPADPVLEQTEPDRAVIRDDDREVCATCGELPANSTTWPGRCKRCERDIQDERERDY